MRPGLRDPRLDHRRVGPERTGGAALEMRTGDGRKNAKRSIAASSLAAPVARWKLRPVAATLTARPARALMYFRAVPEEQTDEASSCIRGA